MKKIRLFYNIDCRDCARLARITRRLDWLNRVELSTEVPPTGPLAPGQIAVQDLRSNCVYLGLEATRNACRQIPAYVPYGILLRIPFVARWASRKKPGCKDDSCSS